MSATTPSTKTRVRGARADAKPSFGTVTLTHAERVVFAEGYTKRDVAAYYAAVMPQFLAGVAKRPLSIVRCPDGTAGACFFQKHALAGLKRVREVALREESGVVDSYLYVADADGVFELVQFNAIEFHPWAAKVRDPERTDYIVFDLDPGPGVDWPRVVAAAELVRAAAADEGLESFVRTSGGKGLHVVIPLNPAAPWERAKAFAHALAANVAEERPREFVAVASKAKRRGRIFIDYLRNTRGATSIASYSLRARPGAPVAFPLSWRDLRRIRSAAEFTLADVPARLARRRRDPWEGFATLRQSLPKAAK
ncbi:MAG TPA: non-homologous end-joining DNA ligase [Rudaea sp.]|nr:non-homologous end-joining DNA ligase [Rudaea sp.]